MTSSHDLLSPFNTLDPNPKKDSFPLPPKKTENPLSKSYSTSSIPIKIKNIPGALTGYDSFKNLLDNYPAGTFTSEKEALSSVTKNHVNILSDSNSEDEKGPVCEDNFDAKSCYSVSKEDVKSNSFFDFYAPDSPQKRQPVSLNIPLNSFTKPKPIPNVLVSNFQYKSVILPPKCSSEAIYQDFKLFFVQNDRLICLTSKFNHETVKISIPFAKISRVQFIRQDGISSADWYIDFVLNNYESLNFDEFGLSLDISKAEAVAYEEFNTLRINLAHNCGLSRESIENILLQIIRDRNNFNFTSKRDPYGEFEKTVPSPKSPQRQTPTRTLQSQPSQQSKSSNSIRIVPSLEKLSSSESVKISQKRCSNSIFQSNIFMPKRTSNRLKAMTSSPKQEYEIDDKPEDSVYIDPDFQTDRVM